MCVIILRGAEDGVIETHLFGEAVEGGARRMNAGRNALAIIGAEALVAAGYIEKRGIELLVEGFREGFAEPFQARGWRSILEGNDDHGAADDGAGVRRSAGGGRGLRAKRWAEGQRDHRGGERDE